MVRVHGMLMDRMVRAKPLWQYVTVHNAELSEILPVVVC